MRSRNDKRAKQKYAKASSVLDCLYVVLFGVNLLLKKFDFWNSALYLTVVSLIFTVMSGYVAYLHSKLPKNQREKPNWIAASDFSMHPYFTFFLFAVFSIISTLHLFTILLQ